MTDFESIIDGPVWSLPYTVEHEIAVGRALRDLVMRHEGVAGIIRRFRHDPRIDGPCDDLTKEEFFDFLKAAFEWKLERENDIENDDEDTMT